MLAKASHRMLVGPGGDAADGTEQRAEVVKQRELGSGGNWAAAGTEQQRRDIPSLSPQQWPEAAGMALTWPATPWKGAQWMAARATQCASRHWASPLPYLSTADPRSRRPGATGGVLGLE